MLFQTANANLLIISGKLLCRLALTIKSNIEFSFEYVVLVELMLLLWEGHRILVRPIFNAAVPL